MPGRIATVLVPAFCLQNLSAPPSSGLGVKRLEQLRAGPAYIQESKKCPKVLIRSRSKLITFSRS